MGLEGERRSERFVPYSHGGRKGLVALLDAAKAFKGKVATKTGTMKAAFYPAEDYHQDYAFRNPNQPYIRFHDAPKVENLKKMFAGSFRDKPVLVADKGM